MSNSRLYGIWKQRLEQLLPDKCASRVLNMLWLMMGMYQAQTVYLTQIARKLPLRAQKLSLDKRLRRFLANEAVDVRAWYHPWADWLIRSAASGGSVHLIIDTSKVSSGFRKISVAVAYRRRALPLMWDWVPYARGHCTVQQQISLLQQMAALLPAGVRVSLVGDGEFGNPLLIEYLDFWGWDYALRQKCDTLIWMYNGAGWQRLDQLGLRRGERLWLGHVVLTEASSYPCHIVAYWRPGEAEPLFLATNQPEPTAALRLYRRRMWIEEMFGDMKGHGFDLEASCLRHADRLSRLTLAVCILYLWLVALGEHVLCHRLQAEVDRADRCDLSIFRLGWDWLERRLALDDPIPPLFRPNFCLVSGG
jgi:hypothetical protein